MILAPLRGVTVRCFREVFAGELAAAGFDEAVTPFIAANAGVDPLRDRELAGARGGTPGALAVTPQFIGKDPAALRACLERVKAAGFATADLNCGCPYPMVRNKGRGSGLLRTPDVLERMIAVGCDVMGAGRFSLKARLGVERSDELLALLPMIDSYPLRFLAVHARTARQMYAGSCDWSAYGRVAARARVRVVKNGDLAFPPAAGEDRGRIMIGRGFVRHLGGRGDVRELLARYLAASEAELGGERAVLGRMKELVAYWKDLPRWNRLWPVVKIARTVGELRLACGLNP